MARLAATGLAAPRNEQERALVALYDRAYDSGWDDAIDAAAALIKSGVGMTDLVDSEGLEIQAEYILKLKETKTDGASSVSIQVPRDCAGEKA